MIFQFAGDFFPFHHVGFRIPLSHFTDFSDLLCIHGYHYTLYTVEPELVLQNMIFSRRLNRRDKSSKLSRLLGDL